MRIIMVLAYFVVVVNGISPEYQEKLLTKLIDAADKCIPEVGATDVDVGELMEHKPPSRREGKCLLACYARETGMLKNGKPDKDATIAAMSDLQKDDPAVYDKVMQVFKKCAQEVPLEKDLCEFSSKFALCCVRVGTEMGLTDEELMG